MSMWPALGRSSCYRRSVSRSLFLATARCKYKNNFILWKSKGRKFKGVVLTGASATTCAIIYMTLNLKSHGHDNVWKHLKASHEKESSTVKWMEMNRTEDEQKESEVFDLFYNVGWEDDWLACPLSALVSQTRSVYESNAFIKLNIAELLSPWEQSNSDDPWVLLQLSKSRNFWVRQMGVACLANKTDWEAYKYRNVAQACEYQTVIALARYPQANDAYFFSQPKLCQSDNDVLTDVKNLLKKMPEPETVKCNIAFYRDLALPKEILFQKDPLTMDLLNQFYTLPGEEEKKKDQGLRYCLQALEAYTAEEPFAHLFVKLHGLALLQRLHEEDREDGIEMYILIILNNLSQCPHLAKDLVHAGWIHELHKWSQGCNTTFSIMADTILANLDRDWIGGEFYKNMILLHPTQRNSQPVNADIVLVHGLRGGAVKTWRQRDKERNESCDDQLSDCWPKDWLSCEFHGTRIISVGYNSTLHQWGDQCPFESDRRTLEGRSKELIQHLLKAGVGTRPIIWMGHSMGGLLIKEILRLSENNPSQGRIVANTKGIVMYSVPHRGSHLVDIMNNAKYLLFPSVEVLEMSTYSEKLQKLHKNFVEMMTENSIPCLSFGENEKTEFGRPFPSIFLVSAESSNPGVGEYVSLQANHVDTCKPSNQKDPMYLRTLLFLQDVLRSLHTATTNKETKL